MGARSRCQVQAGRAAPATAQTTGNETFSGTIVTSGSSGERVVVSSVVVAKGVGVTTDGDLPRQFGASSIDS